MNNWGYSMLVLLLPLSYQGGIPLLPYPCFVGGYLGRERKSEGSKSRSILILMRKGEGKGLISFTVSLNLALGPKLALAVEWCLKA